MDVMTIRSGYSRQVKSAMVFLKRPPFHRIVIAAVIAVVVPTGLLFGLIQYGRALVPRNNSDHYQRIELGMTRTEVKAIVGRDPDYSCRFRDATVDYFFPRVNFRTMNPGELPGMISIKDEIPDIYAAIQVLRDREGTVRAIAWTGESNYIKTLKGEVVGSNVRVLADDYFE